MLEQDEALEAVEDAQHAMDKIWTHWAALKDADERAWRLTDTWSVDERASLYTKQLGRYRSLYEAAYRRMQAWLEFKP